MIWADRNLIINDMNWSKTKKELLQRQPEKIDILKLIDDSLKPIKEVHEKFIDYQLTEKVKNSCYYLNEIFGRTLPVKAVAWYVCDFKGHELTPGHTAIRVGVDYVELNWQNYRIIKEYIKSREMKNDSKKVNTKDIPT